MGPVGADEHEILALVRLSKTNPTGGNYQPRVTARAQADPRNGYSARLTHSTTGALTWGLSRVANAGGSGTMQLGAGTLVSSGAAGTRWWIRLRVSGTTVQARFWRDGAPEPSSWTATATDSYWAGGRPSFGVYVGPVAGPYPDTGFASFRADDLG